MDDMRIFTTRPLGWVKDGWQIRKSSCNFLRVLANHSKAIREEREQLQKIAEVADNSEPAFLKGMAALQSVAGANDIVSGACAPAAGLIMANAMILSIDFAYLVWNQFAVLQFHTEKDTAIFQRYGQTLEQGYFDLFDAIAHVGQNAGLRISHQMKRKMATMLAQFIKAPWNLSRRTARQRSKARVLALATLHDLPCRSGELQALLGALVGHLLPLSKSLRKAFTDVGANSDFFAEASDDLSDAFFGLLVDLSVFEHQSSDEG